MFYGYGISVTPYEGIYRQHLLSADFGVCMYVCVLIKKDFINRLVA